MNHPLESNPPDSGSDPRSEFEASQPALPEPSVQESVAPALDHPGPGGLRGLTQPPASEIKKPDWNRIGFHQVDARNIQVEMIASLIFALVVSIGLIVGLIVLVVNLGLIWPFWLALGVSFLLAGALFGFAIFWPRVDHRNTSYRIDAEGVEIQRGVFWRHRIIVPIGRVQHADVSQGPLQRLYELGTLTVHTAGTQNASVGLEGLEHQLAVQLRDQIVQQRRESDGV